MSKPNIAIVANQYVYAEEVFHHHPATYVPQFYVDAITAAGAIPVILPLTARDEIEKYAETFDGFLFTGGQSVAPFLYGHEPKPLVGQTLLIRDQFEISLAKAVWTHTQKPILGVCRGEQILNVALGGTLNQNLEYRKRPHIKHMQVPSPDTEVTHFVQTTKESYLSATLGDKFLVNSLHSQSIETLAPDFELLAQASDEVIEAVQSTDAGHRFFGVQWHPEMLLKENPEQLIVFKHLVDLAIKTND